MSDLTRRNLLVIAGASACAGCLAETSAVLADDDDEKRPRRRKHDDDEGQKGPTVKSIAIGKLSDYPKAGFYDKYRPQKVMVSKLDDRLVVMSAICTHKGCTVKVQPADSAELFCPCHKALFSDQGTATKGPAKASLVRYAVSQAADGTITADLTKSFAERQWDDAAAFIPLPKT